MNTSHNDSLNVQPHSMSHCLNHHRERLPSMYPDPLPPIRPLLTHMLPGNGGNLVQHEASING